MVSLADIVVRINIERQIYSCRNKQSPDFNAFKYK